jgi:hypothetical protein
MQDFSSLGIELLKYGYHKIFFLETDCLRCGTWRVALSAHSDGGITDPSCPQCRGNVAVSPILCWGFTRRETPFCERIKAPMHLGAMAWVLTQVDDDDERDRRRIRREQAKGKQRASHYRQQIPESHFADNPKFA